ncbi:MAG: hypothetical protein J6Z31_00275 [Fibrobacter sp.]|nr:hypothetical protein [Fibrobacter sp.]
MKITHLGLGVAFFLAGCNIFNPSDDVSVDTSDASMLTYEGQSRFRDGEYQNAANYFKNAILDDSTKSEAWFGLSKANLYLYCNSPFDLIGELDTEADIPLMNLDSAEIAMYFKAVNSSLIPLRELIRRDTLTEQDPTLKLSDRVVTYSNFSASHAILEFAYTILRFRYTNASSISVSLNEDGSINLDIQNLYEQSLSDKSVAEQLNRSIDSLKEDLSTTLDIILPKASQYIDDANASQLIGEQIEANAETVQNSIAYYKLGDEIDNDGDGCVDEEILDGKDNDGDGLIDEDLRLVPIITTETETIIEVGEDSLDHDMNGIKEDLGERMLLTNGRLLFAEDFDKLYKMDSLRTKVRQAIAKDTDSTNIQIPLSKRQKLIGRCWNNYTEETFKTWFRNR